MLCPTKRLVPVPSEKINDSRNPTFAQIRSQLWIGGGVTESNLKVGLSSDHQGTSGRGSGLVKPLRFGISTLGSDVASRTVSSVTMLFR